jgi:hypothetical protein
VLAVLADSPKPMSTAALEAHVDLRRTRLETMLKVLDVDGAVQRVTGRLDATGPGRGPTTRTATPACPPTAPPSSRRCATTPRRRLPDAVPAPAARRPGRSSPAPPAVRALRPLHGRLAADEVSPEALGGGVRRAGPAGVEVEPRKMWPTGLGEVKGRIPADVQAESGARSGGCPTSAGAPGCARCSTARTAGARRGAGRRHRRAEGLGVGRPADGRRGRAPPAPGRSSSAASPRAWPRSDACRCSARSTCSATCRPVPAGATAPSG